MNPKSVPDESRADDTYSFNMVLRERLLELRKLPQFSNNSIAKSLGVSSSIVSQYLNEEGCIYPGDIASLERKITDFLENNARRRASGVDTIASGNTDQMRQALEFIRKTNDCGIILDESGNGKSRAAELYAKNNPTAIYFRTFTWNRAARDAESFMFDVAGKNGYDNRTKRAIHAVNKLQGSDRLVIVDDAHFLHHTALLWWVHFHEATQMPIVFSGTFKLLDSIESDPQIFSRVGLRYEITTKDKTGKLILDDALIKHLINEFIPDANGSLSELVSLCEQVAGQHGHYRSVHKQLKVAVEIKAGKKSITWPQAFRAAHTMLVRNYDLN